MGILDAIFLQIFEYFSSTPLTPLEEGGQRGYGWGLGEGGVYLDTLVAIALQVPKRNSLKGQWQV